MATLYVVATPIGNLEDLSPRAAQVLLRVPVVAAESVKRTRRLLAHLGAGGKRLISCREANRRRAAAQVRQALDAGRDVALVSDAGTPGVSDPGGYLVRELAGSGHRISPIPGPSALTAAVSVAGWAGAPFLFLGFLPAKPGPRRRLLARARDTGWPLVIFEAPHRLTATAADLAALMGERAVVMTRELTKLHEQVLHTTCRELAASVNSQVTRGEITLLVSGGEPRQEAEGRELDQRLQQGLEAGRETPSHLARRVAAELGLPRDEVYRRLLTLKRPREQA